jgi:hypothetical protein
MRIDDTVAKLELDVDQDLDVIEFLVDLGFVRLLFVDVRDGVLLLRVVSAWLAGASAPMVAAAAAPYVCR